MLITVSLVIFAFVVVVVMQMANYVTFKLGGKRGSFRLSDLKNFKTKTNRFE